MSSDPNANFHELPGLESFGEIGVGLFAIVSPEAWANAALAEREEHARALHTGIRGYWGLASNQLEIADTLGTGVRGRFNSGTHRLQIARWLLGSDIGNALKTVAHENRHDLQAEVLAQRIPHPAAARGQGDVARWQEGVDAYRRDRGDFARYSYNPLETDARAAACGVLVGYWRAAYERARID